MKTKFGFKTTAARRGALLSLPLLVASASPGYALDVYLQTGVTTMTPPGATAPITMWGYQSCDSSFTTCGAISVPGPAINVPANDSTGLTVHLSNTLPEPTSLVIDGLPIPTGSTPVWDDGSSGKRTSPSQRVRSMTSEAAANNGSASYSWPSVKPGTFLYRSATHIQVQDQMGLYGSVTHNVIDPVAAANANPAVPGQAYSLASSAFDADVTLLYSEIDPVIHAAVAGNTFGPHLEAGVDQCTLPVSAPRTLPAGWVCSTVNYEPKYFLINGKPYNSASPSDTTFTAAGAYQKTLLRFLNAGLQTHVPVLTGLDMTQLAEDGNVYPFPKTQYSAFLPAMKTLDAIIEPQSNAKLPVMDRMLNLTNNGAATGGMLAFLDVVGSGPTPLPTAIPTAKPTPVPTATPTPSPTAVPKPVAVADGPYAVNAAKFSGNVLTNDASDPANLGKTLTAIKLTSPAKGTVTFNSNGSFSYFWTGTSAGADSFNYKVNDGKDDSAPATVSLSVVNTAPVAVDDSVLVTRNRSLLISVLSNDSDAENNINTAAVNRVSQALHGSAVVNGNGTITYAPGRNYLGSDSFTYSVADKAGVSSNVATVNVCVGGCTQADAYTVPAGSPAFFDVAAPGVLANDVSVTGTQTATLLTTSLTRNGLTGAANLLGASLRCPAPNPGNSPNATKICSNGAFRLNLPTVATDRPGTYTFQYRQVVGGVNSAPVTVTVTVQ